MASATIPINSITKNMIMTVKMTGVKIWKIRVKIAMQFIKIASWIMGVGIEIEKADE